MSDIESSDSESIDSDSQVKHVLQNVLFYFYIVPTLPEICLSFYGNCLLVLIGMKIEIGFRQFHSSITCYMSIEFRKYTIV